MAKKNESKDQGTRIEERGSRSEEYVDSSIVYDLRTLWEMKFMDPISGEICMVRKAFKPRGKLELYHPEER